jgi:NitT/TauT family transport system permease protein
MNSLIKKNITPFEDLKSLNKTTILIGWLTLMISCWVISASASTTHLFPTPKQIITGLVDLWNEGLVVHIFSSITLCVQAVILSIIISLILAYSSTIALFKPIGNFISKLRYLPLTGIAFYMAILISEARSIQIGVLTLFMTTFLTTSLLQMIKDIDEEEFSHARTLGCNHWEILLEVVIKGRFDYVFELVRQNLAMVWMAIVTIEGILAAAGGLGLLIKNNDKLGDNGKVIALQIIILLIGSGLDFSITKLRKSLFRYSNY